MKQLGLETMDSINPYECKHCGSDNLSSNGYRYSESTGQAISKRLRCGDCGKESSYRINDETPSSGDEHIDQKTANKNKRRVEKKTKKTESYFVFTSAQNASYVFEPFIDSLKSFVKHHDAELAVIPYRYRNPTSIIQRGFDDDDWWDDKITPYLLDKRIKLTEDLEVFGDIRMQPTAVRPLSGLDTISGGRSAIFAHPKMELKCIPTPQNSLPKIVTTTGTVTERNYTPTKAGKKGEHHHTYAATLVKVKGDKFFIHQLVADETGCFYYLNERFTPNGVENYGRVPALITGDSHVEQIDEGVVRATYTDKNSIVNKLDPEQIIFHDLLDFRARNHHDRNKFFVNYQKELNQGHIVEDEVHKTVNFLDDVVPEDTQAVIVASNHDEAFERWLEETTPQSDPQNAWFWIQTMAGIMPHPDEVREGEGFGNPLEFWTRKILPDSDDKVRFLRRGEHYSINGIEVSYHGDKGPNGTRGSSMSLSKMGIKVIIGHGHAPNIHDGAMSVGTSSKLDMGYNSGQPSSWLHAHALIYPNGKRSLVFIVDGEWD